MGSATTITFPAPTARADIPATPSPRQRALPTREAIVQRRLDVLLMHWRLEPEALRGCLPDSCLPDVYGSGAWVTVSAARVRQSRWARLPRAFGVDYAELEVSARVRWQGTPAAFILRREASRRGWASLARCLGFTPAERAEIAHEPFADEHALWDLRLPGGEPWYRAWCQTSSALSTTSATLERFLVRGGAMLHLAHGRLRVGLAQQRATVLRRARAVVVVDRLLPSLGIRGLASMPTQCHYVSAMELRLSRPVLA